MESTLNTVTISSKEYARLVEDSTRLEVLKEIRRKNVKSSLKYVEPSLTEEDAAMGYDMIRFIEELTDA